MPLWGVVPAFHVAGVVLHLSVEVLDTVGRFQAPPQLLEEPKSMERERFLQAFSKGACRLAVDLLQLRVKTGKPLFGRLGGRFLVSPLEPGSPRFLVGLRQMADYVFSLVSLAALNLSSVSEDLANGLAQALAAIDDAKNAVVEAEATPDKVPQQLSDRLSSLGCRLCKPENLLVALLSDSHAEGLPVRQQFASRRSREPGSSLPPETCFQTPPGPVGPAQRNRRLTEDWLRPNPSTNWLATSP